MVLQSERVSAKGFIDGAPHRATQFFAPAQAKKRAAELGAAEFGKRLVDAWQAFAKQVISTTPPWIAVPHLGGHFDGRHRRRRRGKP